MYEPDFRKVLMLPRQRDLRKFFRKTEVVLLYADNVFNSIKDKDIKKYVKNVVLEFRNKNLENIKKHIVKNSKRTSYLLEIK